MCLHFKLTENSNPLVAQQDREVFKVLHKTREGALISPFRQYPYELNKECESDLGEAEIVVSSTMTPYFQVSEGLHSVATYNEARRLIIRLKMDSISFGQPVADNRIFRAIIPEGAVYYIGINGDVVSNRLKLLEEAYS